MSWSESFQFRQTYANILDHTITTLDFDAAGMFKVALYNNTITPDKDAAAVAIAYNTGQWATAQEIWQAGEWAQGGVTLLNNDITVVTGGIVQFDADDAESADDFTATGINGALVYADGVSSPVADIGVSAVWFGGTAFQVTNGVFRIKWSTSGISRYLVSTP